MQSGIFREEDVSAEGCFRKGGAENRTIFWGGRTFEEEVRAGEGFGGREEGREKKGEKNAGTYHSEPRREEADTQADTQATERQPRIDCPALVGPWCSYQRTPTRRLHVVWES